MTDAVLADLKAVEAVEAIDRIAEARRTFFEGAVDWSLLAEQKATLVRLRGKLLGQQSERPLTGIIHMIDAMELLR